MKIIRLLFGATILAISCQALAGERVLTPHTAEYKVKISLVSGRLKTELRSTEEGYIANHVITPTGMSRMITRGTMDVTSEFSDEPDGVKPIRFRAVDTIKDDPDVDLSFDWNTNRVTGTVGEDNVELQLEGLSHDNVSIQYELMHDLLSENTTSQYTLFDVDKLRKANISRAGSRRVKTKAGEFTAVGIQHQKEGSLRITTLWCVEELDYLPVVIEQHRKGKLKFRASLVSYTPTRE